jgi:hypothetical protein
MVAGIPKTVRGADPTHYRNNAIDTPPLTLALYPEYEGQGARRN